MDEAATHPRATSSPGRPRAFPDELNLGPAEPGAVFLSKPHSRDSMLRMPKRSRNDSRETRMISLIITTLGEIAAK